MTVTDVRTLLKNVVEAHATHNTFYSIWSVAKDRASELEYPCVIWDQWRSRLVDDPQGYLHRSVLIRLLIITSVPTDRTPLERDQAVEAADNAASDIVLKIREDYRDLELSNISTTTMFDEYTQLETGVLLTFTLMGDGLCLDQNQFPGTNCPTFAELISTLSWPQIKADMSDAQIAEATEDLGGEDATAKVNGTTYGTVAPGDDIDIRVVRASDNSAIGTVTPGVSVSIPSGRAMTTNGLVEVVSVPPGVDVPLPQSVINYITADGSASPTPLGPYDTLYSAGTLKGGAAPRFVVRRASDGTTIIATGDIANPFVELSPQEVRNSEDTVVRYHEVDEPVVAPDATVQLKDSGGVNIGSPVSVPSGTSANITAPDGTVTVRNLNGTALGSPSVKSNGTANYTAPIPIKMGWGAGDADTLEWTVTDAEAGTYNSYTQDGGSGTITYSKNGAAFAALSGTITLAVGNTIKVRRTTTTNAGYSTWAP